MLAGYLKRLKRQAEASAGHAIDRVVLGRPVFFVDDDPERDRAAQAALERAARQVGFTDIAFQFEPIAAALDYETTIDTEQIVLVADIGGGTSDFSLVRLGPQRRQRLERGQDILANHGVHIAGTDFDRHLSLRSIMPTLGLGSFGPSVGGQAPRPVPSRVYFDLATWHLINTVYAPARVLELRRMREFYADTRHHDRLLQVLQQRLGHALIARAEAAKITVAEGGTARLDLGALEPGLQTELDEPTATQALQADLGRIVQAAADTLRLAGVTGDDVDALYLTGGSTGLAPLVRDIAARCPRARVIRGDRYASVAQGLGVHARRVFG